MSGAWRCFVAVPIGEELRVDLASALEGWQSRDDLAPLHWSDPSSWHVTLAFLGETDPATIGVLAARLELVAAAHAAFALATGGLGGFPSASRARVAWYGIEDRDGRLRRLAGAVGNAVDREPDREFTAHLTLGRTRAGSIDLRDWARDAKPPDGRLSVDRVDLVRSHLGTGLVQHETLASVWLGSPVKAGGRSVRLGRNR